MNMKRSKVIRHRYSGILEPDWSRLEEAHLIKRDPDTLEISWGTTSMEDQLRKAGLL